MAASDVFGIFALLLAALGAAYLLRTRLRAAPSSARRRDKDGEEDASSRLVATVPPRRKHPSRSSDAPASTLESVPPPPATTPTPTRMDEEAPEARPSATDAPAEPADDRPEVGEPEHTTPEGPVVPSKEPAPMAAAEPAKASTDAKQTWSRERAQAQVRLDDLPLLDLNPRDDEGEDADGTRVGVVKSTSDRPPRKEIRPPVERHVIDEGADRPWDGQGAAFVLAAVAKTDTGRRRKHNEDSLLSLASHQVYGVADGMGGHRGGQRASQLAVTVLAGAFEEQRFEARAHEDLPAPASELARAVQMANASILEEARQNESLRGMGTTLVALRFTDGGRRLYIAHVGDSRCYRLREGAMRQLTQDHTMATLGVAGPEGAHLSRAVGVWPTVPIDVLYLTPEPGDLYLVCSDGLTKMLTDETIAAQLSHEHDATAAIDRLIMFANARGGKDNISLLLIRVEASAATGS